MQIIIIFSCKRVIRSITLFHFSCLHMTCSDGSLLHIKDRGMLHAGAVAIRKRRKNQNKKEEDIDGIVRQTK